MEPKELAELQMRFIELAHIELLEALRAQRWAVNFAVAITGASASVSAAMYKDGNSIISGIIMLVSGFLCALIFNYWSGEFTKIARSSDYCLTGERQIGAVCADVELFETWIRKDKGDGRNRFTVAPYTSVMWMFMSLSFIPVIFHLVIINVGRCSIGYTVTGGVSGALIGMLFYAGLLELRKSTHHLTDRCG